MQDKNCSETTNEGLGATHVVYSIKPSDIFRLLIRIHGVLVVLPITFLAGYILVITSKYYVSWQPYVYFFLFLVSLVGMLYIFLSYYLIFKKLYFYEGSDTEYHAEFSANGLRVFTGKEKNVTEYQWNDFSKCHETSHAIYLYFRFDKALIIKKQQFVSGNIKSLRLVIESNIKKHRLK